MRNLKKFFALVLAMLMIVSATAIVSADFADVAADNIYAKAINDLADKKITVGGDSGFNPDGMVTRWQMALFVARAMTGEVDNAVWANGINIFDDVNDGHYKGAISHAYLNNVILGVGDNKFNPDGNITYGAALKMAVCALGYEVKYDATNWALAFYGKAQELGLTAGVAVYDLDQELTRAETAQVIYNMIYAAPAAKDAKTFAAANFAGIVGVAEDDLFVITATPKQAFAGVALPEDADAFAGSTLVDTDEYVGIQALVNGAPAGEVTYIKAADLGIAVADVEDYFLRSVVLTNYKGANKFDACAIGNAPVAVRSNDITLNNNGTYAIAGTNYSLVADVLTNSSVKNELILLAGSTVGVAADVALTLDKDGNVLDPISYDPVAEFKATKADGTKVYTVASDYDANGIVVAAGTYTEDELKEIAGLAEAVAEDGVAQDVLTEIPGAAVIYLYDDYGDARFERAVAEQVYMTSYYTEKHDVVRNNKTVKDAVCDMIATGIEEPVDDYITVDEVTYSDESVKVAGTVFTFTYNAALNEVTVLDIADKTTAKLTSVSTKKDSNGVSHYYAVLGGKTYSIDAVDADTFGATLITKAVGGASATLANFADGKYFNTNVAGDGLMATLKGAMNVDYTFYAIGDKLIYIQAVTPASAKYDIVVYNEFNDVDLGEILVDVYANGKLVEAASLYGIEDGILGAYDKVVVADLTKTLVFTAFAEAIADPANIAVGTVFAVTTVDGAYNLEFAIVDDATAEEAGLIKVEDTITFTGKVSNAADKEDRVRTNSNTVFYFIDTDASTNVIKTYVGAAADGDEIDLSGDVAVYVDKLGIGTADTNGIASLVLVIGDDVDSAITGLGVAQSSDITATDKIVTTTACDTTAYEYKLAADFGLDVENASTTYYYAYTVLNVADATSLVVYAENNLSSNTMYVVAANGIVKEGVDPTPAVDAYDIDDVDADAVYTDDETGYLVVEGAYLDIDAANKLTGFKVIDVTEGKILEGEAALAALYAGEDAYTIKDALKADTAVAGGILVCVVD